MCSLAAKPDIPLQAPDLVCTIPLPFAGPFGAAMHGTTWQTCSFRAAVPNPDKVINVMRAR